MRIIRLGEVSQVTSSKRIFAKQYVDKGVPFYRQKEIIEISNGNEISDPLFISEDVYENIKKSFGAPKKGDLLITAVGVTLGIPYLVGDEKFYFKDGNLIWCKEFEDDINPKYVYYWIKSDVGQKAIWSRTIGSAQPALTIDLVKQYEVSIPDIETQNKVVRILDLYDCMIENNQKQIKMLEEAAQRLYKEWFVDLRFPGYKDVQIVDGVPEGWDILLLGDAISYEIGGGWGEDTVTGKNEHKAYVIRGTDFDGLRNGEFLGIPLRFHTESNLSSRRLEHGDIVFEVSGGSRTEGVARTVRIISAMLNRWNKPVICASFCKLIRPLNIELSQYLFDHLRYLRAEKITEEFDKRSASSIVNFRWKDFLSQRKILYPDRNVLAKYNSVAVPIYEKIVALSLQIETAKMARDRLLPKLMSGEIEL